MRRNRVLWNGLAVCLVALGLYVGESALTTSPNASSCQGFSQLRAADGRSHLAMDSLARAQSVTLTRVSGGGLQVAWMFNQDPPNLGQESVGELEVDIQQGPQELILAAPTLGTTAWSELGEDVNIATVHQLPAEVLVTYSKSQVFDLTGPFNWNAGVDYGLLYGVTSKCPAPGSPGVNGG